MFLALEFQKPKVYVSLQAQGRFLLSQLFIRSRKIGQHGEYTLFRCANAPVRPRSRRPSRRRPSRRYPLRSRPRCLPPTRMGTRPTLPRPSPTAAGRSTLMVSRAPTTHSGPRAGATRRIQDGGAAPKAAPFPSPKRAAARDDAGAARPSPLPPSTTTPRVARVRVGSMNPSVTVVTTNERSSDPAPVKKGRLYEF